MEPWRSLEFSPACHAGDRGFKSPWLRSSIVSMSSNKKEKKQKKAKAFCPSCRKMSVPKKKGTKMWCGDCGDPID